MGVRLLLVYGLAFVSFSLYSKADDQRSLTETATSDVFNEYLEYLTLPNVATQSAADIRKVAEWTAAKYSEYGVNTQLLDNEGMPMVYADYMLAGEDAPTVLFYAHMDGQPVNPEVWEQESPWQPVLK